MDETLCARWEELSCLWKLGPWITTVDEIDDFSSLKLETHVNGKLTQAASAAEVIFSLSELIAYISNLTPLNPGDIIATGSPDGTGEVGTLLFFLNQGIVWRFL